MELSSIWKKNILDEKYTCTTVLPMEMLLASGFFFNSAAESASGFENHDLQQSAKWTEDSFTYWA